MTTYDDNNQDNEPVYVSIYDKKPRKTPSKKHVFTAIPLTVEEKRIRACLIAQKYYHNHSAEINAKKILYRESIKLKKINNQI